MLKKLLFIAAVCIGCTGGNLNAAVVNKSPQEVKIYINPGHGGFNSNCRPMGTVKRGANVTTATTANDTTAFFESNTNLWKCLAMYYKLLDYGVPRHSGNALYDASKDQHIVMSRIRNGNDTDRGLSTDIAVEVEKFSPDIFISVHSNASPDGSIGTNENYPLVIYRGEDYRSTAFTDTDYGKNWDYAGTGLNKAGSSYEFGKLVYSHLATIEHEPYTGEWVDQYVSGYTPLKTEHNVRGDVNLMAYFDKLNGKSYTLTSNRGDGVTNTYSNKKYYGYYGVMKHGAVGVLSEGYMHTYYPSVNRHMNKDVCAIEGISYAHAIADYFGWEKEKTGYIYGIVRDRNNTFTHTYYIPNKNTDDIYKPLNNCTVNLYKDGKLVDTYVTDDEWNGAFVFYDLEPGDYTLDYVCDGYQPASEGLKSTVVTVKANEISYPKAFLNATGYAMNSEVSMSTTPVATHSVANWYGGSSSSKIYPRQIAVSNDVVYLIMVGGKRISYWNAATGTDGSFEWGASGSNGMGICTDDYGNVIFASKSSATTTCQAYNERMQEVTICPKSSGPGVVVSTDNAKVVNLSSVYTKVLSGKNNSSGATTNSAGLTRVIRASGNCYSGTGALWLTNGLDVVKINIVNGAATTQETFTTPLTDSSFSGAFGGSHNEDMAKESSFFPYTDGKYMMIGRNGTFLCTLNGSAVDGFEYVENTWYAWNSADIEYIGGHEIIVHQANVNSGTNMNGKITVIDRSTGQTLASGINATGSAATPVTTDYITSANMTVNAWCEFDVIDNNTLALYTYVPNNGLAKYLITYTNLDEAVEIPAAAGEAVTAESNYENDITVTWEKPDSWTEEPTNYLIKYQTYYTMDNGTIQYINPSGFNTTSEYWHNLGMTEDATCRFVHEGAQFAHDGESKIYPLTYSYMIIPNFNCYDGEASVMSNTVTVGFVAPKPEMDEFAIKADHNGVELNGYDGSVTWNGVDFTENNQFALKGYKFELYNSKDNSIPVKSFTFNADDAKHFGAIDNETGEGAMLDTIGNTIDNLTYSIADGKKLFRYSVKDLDVLDIVDGEVNTNIFTAHVSAMYDIEGAFVYSDESVKKVKPYQYELKAPGTTAKVGTFKTGQTDAEGYTFDTYWVEMNITEPDYGDAEAIPVSHYLISMDKDKDGVADEYASMLYVYDAAESLGIELETGEGINNNAIITGVSTMSLRSTTSPAQLPGTYDFDQSIPSGESMVSFPVSVASGSSDNPKEYQYSVEAVYAAGNAEITSVTSATVSNPVDGGTVTGVETVGIDGNPALSVYPVPATVSVTVKSSEAIAKVAIYSGAGVLVKALEGNGAGVMTVNVSDLEEGVYFLHVNTLDPVKVVKK